MTGKFHLDVYVYGQDKPIRVVQASVCEHLARRGVYVRVREELEKERKETIFIKKIETFAIEERSHHFPPPPKKRIKPKKKKWSDGFDTDSP